MLLMEIIVTYFVWMGVVPAVNTSVSEIESSDDIDYENQRLWGMAHCNLARVFRIVCPARFRRYVISKRR
jgi:hypothetical protein